MNNRLIGIEIITDCIIDIIDVENSGYSVAVLLGKLNAFINLAQIFKEVDNSILQEYVEIHNKVADTIGIEHISLEKT